MQPLSITTACVSLVATITKTSISVSTFVRSVRAARKDLDAVSRELASLKTLLELIAEDAKDAESFPETLRKHIADILSHCELVLVEVQRLVEKYNRLGVITASKWALAGSEDAAKLRLSLEAHKSALEIALVMVELSVTKNIKEDTTHLLDDTAVIKQDTTAILAQMACLRAQLPSEHATTIPMDSTHDLDNTFAINYDSGIHDEKLSGSLQESLERLSRAREVLSRGPTQPKELSRYDAVNVAVHFVFAKYTGHYWKLKPSDDSAAWVHKAADYVNARRDRLYPNPYVKDVLKEPET